MKKSIVFALVIALCASVFCVPAFADDEAVSVSLPTVSVGNYVDNCDICTVSTGSSVSLYSGTMPSGLNLSQLNREDGLHVCVSGTPSAPGDYNFIIKIYVPAVDTGEGIIPEAQELYYQCSMSVLPAAPEVSVSSAVSASLGDNVTVSVSVNASAGCSISYQWYANSSESNSGGTALSCENSSSLKVSTSEIGTKYYYCVVNSEYSGVTRTVTSGVIPVTVDKESISSISIASLPTRRSYTVGEKLDTSGLILKITYVGGREEEISSGFSVNVSELKTACTQLVKVSYEGYTCSFEVDVSEPEEIIDSISIVSKPSVTVYNAGDTLNTSGLKIRVFSNLGYTDISTGFTCSPTLLDRPGQQVITVSLEGCTCTFIVTVNEAVELINSISVKTMPIKTEYFVGDRFDSLGMVLTVRSNLGTKEVSSGYTCSPSAFTSAGTQTVTVSYKNVSCTLTVNVKETAGSSGNSSGANQQNGSSGTEQSSSSGISPVENTPVNTNTSVQEKRSGGMTGVITAAAIIAFLSFAAYLLLSKFGGIDGIIEAFNDYIDRFKR